MDMPLPLKKNKIKCTVRVKPAQKHLQMKDDIEILNYRVAAHEAGRDKLISSEEMWQNLRNAGF
jgi:malate synthase